MADLALALVRLRADAPAEVPLELIDRWLDKSRPDWATSLPLRMSQDVADKLIRPVLRSERKAAPASGPLAWRSLVRREAHGWQALLRVADQGFLAHTMLPEAAGLRLRLMPSGAATERAGPIIYGAAPEDNGWSLRRIAGIATAAISLELDVPFSLSAFSDGRLVGEVEIVPALPLPDESPSLWRAMAPPEEEQPEELFPLSGSGKTRANSVWLLAAAGEKPHPGEGIDLSGPFAAPRGVLWRVSGAGRLQLGGRSWLVATGSSEEAPDARLLVRGETLPTWRLVGSRGHVFCGKPQILGQHGSGSIFPLRDANLRFQPARQLMGVVSEWVSNDVVLARLCYVAFPSNATLVLRETGPGKLEVNVEACRPVFQ